MLGRGLTCSTVATATSAVGSYASNCSGAADANYSISYVPGTVTVDPGHAHGDGQQRDQGVRRRRARHSRPPSRAS